MDVGTSERDVEPPASPYQFEIDLTTDNTHANVVRMVGHGKRVLELGPASGYMSEVLVSHGCSVVGIEIDAGLAEGAARFCERVIVGNLDELDLDEELGGERFDAIVAADVLEHLQDPLGALRRLRPFIADGGSFVVSLPNVAHAGVRLALLQGRFEYRDLGLMDRTHLRFFTHDTIRSLFDDAELAIIELHRQEAPIEVADVTVRLDTVPREVIAELEADPDARTYQFVVKAVPLAQPGMRELQARLHDQALALDEAQRGETERTRELEEALAALSAREGEVRAALIDAHDQLLQRDAQIEKLAAKAEEGSRASERVRELEQERVRHLGDIAAMNEQIHRLRTRLDRILGSPPIRAYSRVAGLPLVRRIARRRAAGYERQLESGRPADG